MEFPPPDSPRQVEKKGQVRSVKRTKKRRKIENQGVFTAPLEEVSFMQSDSSLAIKPTKDLFLTASSLIKYSDSLHSLQGSLLELVNLAKKIIPLAHVFLKGHQRITMFAFPPEDDTSSDSSISRTPTPPSSPSSPESLSQNSTDSEDLRTLAIVHDDSPKSALNEAADMLLEQLIETGQRYARGPYVSGGRFKETGEIYSQTYAAVLINNELVNMQGKPVESKAETFPQYIVKNAKLTDSNAHQFIEHLTLSDGSTKALPKRNWHAEENIIYSREWNSRLETAFNEVIALIRISQEQGQSEEALLQILAQKQYEFTILINRSCCPRCAGILTESLNAFWNTFLNQQDINISRGLMNYLKKNVFKFTISSMVLYRTTKESDIAKLKEAGWTIQVHQGLDNQEGEIKDWTDNQFKLWFAIENSLYNKLSKEELRQLVSDYELSDSTNILSRLRLSENEYLIQPNLKGRDSQKFTQNISYVLELSKTLEELRVQLESNPIVFYIENPKHEDIDMSIIMQNLEAVLRNMFSHLFKDNNILESSISFIIANTRFIDLEADDFSLEERHLPMEMPILEARYQGQSIRFQERVVLGDGDCGFYALGLTRNVEVAKLLSMSNNLQIRSLVIQEIYAAFYENKLPAEMPKIQELLDRRIELDQNFRNIIQQANSLLRQNNIITENQSMNLFGFIPRGSAS